MLMANTHSQNSTGQRVLKLLSTVGNREVEMKFLGREVSGSILYVGCLWGSGSSPSFSAQFSWIRLAGRNILGIFATGPEVPVHHKTCANPTDLKPE